MDEAEFDPIDFPPANVTGFFLVDSLLAGDWEAVAAADPRHLREASGVIAAYLAWHLERGLRSFAYLER